MSESIRRARVGGVAYYLNKTSSGRTGGCRFNLYRTSDSGRVRDGFVVADSSTGHALAALVGDIAFFEACQAYFASKPVKKLAPRAEIRGSTGCWEGEAFRARRHAQGAAQ